MPKKSRSYSFTWNNYTSESEDCLKALEYKYLVYGKEVGDSGTPHLQGMITFANQRSPNAVIKLLKGAHVEPTKSQYDSMVYCKKDGDVWEDGDPPQRPEDGGEAEKQRWKRTWDLAKSGELDEIDHDIRVRFYGTLKKIKADHMVVPDSLSSLDFHWWWGDSGTGKSRTARAENPDHYLKRPHKWWDGYTNQSCVIIDEWEPHHENLSSYLKTWADHHAFAAEVKGTSMCIRPPKIIITSNYCIADCFPNVNAESLKALERRFQVRHFGEPNPHVTPGMWTSF